VHGTLECAPRSRSGVRGRPYDRPVRNSESPVVGIAMGSDSDWPTMRAAAEMLARFDVPYEARVLSAHRTPRAMLDWGQAAAGRGIRVVIAGAGGAAHLPGMLAAATTLPVIGVPVVLKTLDGMDSLLSIVQMPTGVPVATVAIGNAANAGLLAVRILGSSDPRLAVALAGYAEELAQQVAAKDAALGAGG
jgi:5-(carboxyamino)imidazole ribonucleotide mutase